MPQLRRRGRRTLHPADGPIGTVSAHLGAAILEVATLPRSATIRRRPLPLTILAVVLLLLAVPVEADEHVGPWLQGTVVDRVTAAPIAGAEVGLFQVIPGFDPQPALGPASFQVSASDGWPAFAGSAAGQATHIGVSDSPTRPLEGYEVLWRFLDVEGAPPHVVDLEVMPITGTPLVAGTVVDAATDEPVPYRYRPGSHVDPLVAHVFLGFDEPDDSPVDFLPFTRGWRAQVGADFFFHGIEQGRSFSFDVLVTGYLPASFVGLVADAELTGALRLVRIGQDVAEDSPHAQGIDWVIVEGIATGYTDGSFGPADPVTRAQMATLLLRALAD